MKCVHTCLAAIWQYPTVAAAAGFTPLPDADAPAPRRVDTSHAVLRADAGGDTHDSAPKLPGRSDWKYAVEQLPLAELAAGRIARMELKDESRTRALVQSRGGGLQPKMQDLESGSGASCPPPPFRMAWISAAMGSVALHRCSPSLPLRSLGLRRLKSTPREPWREDCDSACMNASLSSPRVLMLAV